MRSQFSRATSGKSPTAMPSMPGAPLVRLTRFHAAVLPRPIAPFTCRAKSNELNELPRSYSSLACTSSPSRVGVAGCLRTRPSGSPCGLAVSLRSALWGSCPSTCGFCIASFRQHGRPCLLGLCWCLFVHFCSFRFSHKGLEPF